MKVLARCRLTWFWETVKFIGWRLWKRSVLTNKEMCRKVIVSLGNLINLMKQNLFGGNVLILMMCKEHGNSAVECQALNRKGLGWNSLKLPFWVFSFSPRRPSSLSCINECLAIDGGGNVSGWCSRSNCCVARMLPREVGLVSEWTGLSGGDDKALWAHYTTLKPNLY